MSHVIAPRFIGPAQGNAGYQVPYSCRFNPGDSAYLTRTPGTQGSLRRATLSVWLKRSGLTNAIILAARATGGGHPAYSISFNNSTNKLEVFESDNVGGTNLQLITSRVFRDVSAYYHIVVAHDHDQPVASDRIKIYVNGVQETAFDTATYPSQFQNFTRLNTVIEHTIGAGRDGTGTIVGYNNGYLAQVTFIDNQQLAPSSFGEFDTNGVWRPINVTALTFGTDGYLLDFADASNLGNDVSGNNNDFTSSGLTTADQVIDTPTANFAVFNQIFPHGSGVISDGNLRLATGTNGRFAISTAAVSTGQWYAEFTPVTASGGGGGNFYTIGAAKTSISPTANYIGATADSWGYYGNDGKKYNNGSATSYGNTYTANDVIGVALDLDNGKLFFSKNGTWQNGGDPVAGTNAAFTGLSGEFCIGASDGGATTTCTITANYGQLGFAYSPPTGFKALNTANLPKPAIKDGSTEFITLLHTGNGSTQTISGSDFQPDFIWVKTRSNATNHQLQDAVRGFNLALASSTTQAEGNNTTLGVTAVSSTGFTVGAGTAFNDSGVIYADWLWKANGTGATNTSGSITSTVSANTAAGFSVVTYTGTGSNATVGHGLGRTPKMVIVKKRNSATNSNWMVYHAAEGPTKAGNLNDTVVFGSSTTYWNDTAPTSSVFTLGSNANSNNNGDAFVAYCFAEVLGYSKVGSFDAINSADDAFVYTGFTPAFVLMKKTTAPQNWYITDSARNPYNVADKQLCPNLWDAESAGAYTDLLSNGFKLRFPDTGTYIYIAFAEYPFGGAKTTPAPAR